MKIKLSYIIKHEKEIEISAEEYCKLRANFSYGAFFPSESRERRVSIVDGIDELDSFLFAKHEGKLGCEKPGR